MMLPAFNMFTYVPAYPHDIFILIFSEYRDIYSLSRKKDKDNIFHVIMESH